MNIDINQSLCHGEDASDASGAPTRHRFHITGGPLPDGLMAQSFSSLLVEYPPVLLMGEHDPPIGEYPGWTTGTGCETPSALAQHQQPFVQSYYVSDSAQDPTQAFLGLSGNRINSVQSFTSSFTPPALPDAYGAGYCGGKITASIVEAPAVRYSPAQYGQTVSQPPSGGGIPVSSSMEDFPHMLGVPLSGINMAKHGSQTYLRGGVSASAQASVDRRMSASGIPETHRASRSRNGSAGSLEDRVLDIPIPAGVPHQEKQLPQYSGVAPQSPRSPISALPAMMTTGAPWNPATSPGILASALPGRRPSGRRNSSVGASSPVDALGNVLPSPRAKPRRSSLKTCGLEEAGLDFPGCFVLVPAEEGLYADDSRDLQEAKLSAKKIYRRPMMESERDAIKKNRIYGVCLRCKMFKERCRGGGSGLPCERCRSLKLWKTICVPAQFIDKCVFSRGLYKTRCNALNENVYRWKPVDAVSAAETIIVSNGFAPTLTLTVHEYQARELSLIDHVIWRTVDLPTSSRRRIAGTPYGLKADVDPQTLDRYIDDHLEFIVHGDTRHKGSWADIGRDTLSTACKYVKNNPGQGSLVKKALRIWVTEDLFFRHPWRIVGRNNVGMPKLENDQGTKTNGIVPLPRLVNQQLDRMLESRMAHLEEELLQELQTRIFRRNPTEWFGIYLAIYVFFAAIERDCWCLKTWDNDAQSITLLLSQHGSPEDSARYQQMTAWPLHDKPDTYVRKNKHLTDILLAHFRSVTKGYVPFTLDWSSEQVISMAAGDLEAVAYMQKIIAWLKQVGTDELVANRNTSKYYRNDDDSLNATITSKLMCTDEMIQKMQDT